MEKLIIEVAGHKVTIEGIKGRLGDGIWHKEHYLDVWISFDPPVENVISTGIEFPIKNYGKDEFIQAIKDKLKKKIPEMKDEYRKRQVEREAETKRQEDLDSLASQIETMISK